MILCNLLNIYLRYLYIVRRTHQRPSIAKTLMVELTLIAYKNVFTNDDVD